MNKSNMRGNYLVWHGADGSFQVVSGPHDYSDVPAMVDMGMLSLGDGEKGFFANTSRYALTKHHDYLRGRAGNIRILEEIASWQGFRPQFQRGDRVFLTAKYVLLGLAGRQGTVTAIGAPVKGDELFGQGIIFVRLDDYPFPPSGYPPNDLCKVGD